MIAITLSHRLYFSYSQFMIYDQSVQLPGCDWTKKYTQKGFARRESTVCFGTPLEFGYADVTVMSGSYLPQVEYEQVISVPFRSDSGKLMVDGPEEMDADRVFAVPIGDYKLTAAQTIIGNDERIDLFFESVVAPLKHSSVIVADEMLNPPEPLIERS
jgi:hypothetical protein